MALTARDIANHPALHDVMRRQAGLLLQVRESNHRMASIFASQQRWLMAQAALALHFRTVAAGHRPGITSASFLDLVARHGVASRNTADAFLKEIIQYGYARYVPDKADRRRRPLVPADATLDALHAWCVIHLATLDALFPGRRVEAFVAAPAGLTQFQPLIADGLLSSHGVRQPETTFSLFTWLDNGGWVMDRLMATMEDGSSDAERIVTIDVSISAMAQWLGQACRGGSDRQHRLDGQAWRFGDVGVGRLPPRIRRGAGGEARGYRCGLRDLLRGERVRTSPPTRPAGRLVGMAGDDCAAVTLER